MDAPQPRHAALYVNSRSRRGRDWFERCQASLEAQGFRLSEAKRFKSARNLLLAVKRAARDEKVPLVFVGGGDGTISSVARCFVGSESALGVLPLGTGNALARDLGIPSQPEAACQALANARIREIDLGHAGDDYFVNVATIGLSAQIAAELTDDRKRRFGRAVYLLALVKALANVRPIRASLELEGESHEFETLQVVIGNGRYHAGPFKIDKDASLYEGLLHIYALEGVRKSALLQLAIHLAAGDQVRPENVLTWSAQKGKLVTTPSTPVVVDGEQGRWTPIDFHVVPRAIRVLSPAAPESSPPPKT